MKMSPLDLLCIGHASYDLIFAVDHHPDADEKMFAENLLGAGGGPAANAAVTAARLGFRAGFAGYLGNDVYGDAHLQELLADAVECSLIKRDASPTPLSAILVKPDGKRALINYKGATRALPSNSIDFSQVSCKVALFDGHEPHLALDFIAQAVHRSTPTVLDAGSLHDGTKALMNHMTYLVASEKFALQLAGNIPDALQDLAERAPVVVITLGEHGLVWRRGGENGRMAAPPVNAIDTTGAGDAFHGAFAAAIAAGSDWQTTLRYASAAGGLCCAKIGARSGLPTAHEHRSLLNHWLAPESQALGGQA